MFPDNLHSSLAYEKEMDYYSERFHVLSFDYPGSGRSTREILYQDERELDFWNYSADLACHLLLSLGIDECYVLGAGEGALAALHFAGKQGKLHNITTKGVLADSFVARIDNRTLNCSLDIREHYYIRNEHWLRKQHGDDWRNVVDVDTAFLRRMAVQGGYDLPDFVLNSIACPVLLTGSLRDTQIC